MLLCRGVGLVQPDERLAGLCLAPLELLDTIVERGHFWPAPAPW